MADAARQVSTGRGENAVWLPTPCLATTHCSGCSKHGVTLWLCWRDKAGADRQQFYCSALCPGLEGWPFIVPEIGGQNPKQGVSSAQGKPASARANPCPTPTPPKRQTKPLPER